MTVLKHFYNPVRDFEMILTYDIFHNNASLIYLFNDKQKNQTEFLSHQMRVDVLKIINFFTL